MGSIVVIGGGMCGMTSAMMLARRGHQVTVLERNPEEPPGDVAAAWETWDRPGCGQFRMGHWFLARFRRIIEAELPELLDGFRAAGALESSALDAAPMPVDPADDDDRFRLVTGRRPIMEWVVADAARREPGVAVRRGAVVASLTCGPEALTGVPHVTGVRLDDGEVLDADMVIDAGGRRSSLPAMLTAIGAGAPAEESADCGFRYYGRYFRSADGTLPGLGTVHQLQGPGVTGLVLPADNGTWTVILSASTRDKALYGLTDETRWRAAASLFAAARPWLDAEPITDVETMIGIPDRIRRLVVDGAPVATGVVSIGDAWAATNPSLGRGVSMGMVQAVGVVDAIDTHLDDPAACALAADDATERNATPLYQATLDLDRGTHAVYDAIIDGTPPPEPDAGMAMFMHAARLHQDVFRAFAEVANLLGPLDSVLTAPVFDAMVSVAEVPAADAPGIPTRDALVATAS